MCVCVGGGGGGGREKCVVCVICSYQDVHMYDPSGAMAWLARTWCEHLYVGIYVYIPPKSPCMGA